MRGVRREALEGLATALTFALKLFGIGAQLLVDFGIQIILSRLVCHCLVQLAGDQGFGQRLLAVRPHEQRHLLSLG